MARGTHKTQQRAALAPKTHHSARTQSKPHKANARQVEAGGRQTCASGSPLRGHRTGRVKCSLPEECIGCSPAQGFLRDGHTGALCLARIKIPDTQKESGCLAQTTLSVQTIEAQQAIIIYGECYINVRNRGQPRSRTPTPGQICQQPFLV